MPENNQISSFVKRHIAAAVLMPVFIAYILYLPSTPYFLALLVIVGMIAMREFFVMYRVPSMLNAVSVIVGGALLYLFCLYPDYAVYGIFTAISIVMLLRLFSAETPSGSMAEIGPVGVGFFYVAGCLSFQWFLRDMQGMNGLKYIFALYFSVWCADSMAYYIGTYLGKHKLCPSISPKKTIEGSLGSLLGGVVGIMIAKVIFEMPELSILYAVIIGVVMGITSLVGDLVESMFKRDAGVKDSGNIIPGHGGILDRLDGMFLSGPVIYFMVRYF